MRTDRRELMLGAAASALMAWPARASLRPSSIPAGTRPLPLTAVRLRPSDYATAVSVNRGYLLRLDADRLLHNFRLYAGLKPRAAIYGG